MTRTIQLALKDFISIPRSITDPETDEVSGTLSIPLKQLFHHYFVMKYGADAADDGHYEYERMLTVGPDWRFRGSGIGADKESKRNASNELGKAFTRWFLHQHLDFTYFCPLEDLVGRQNPDGTKWTRFESGDLPDYVCGTSRTDVNLLEAKGRYDSVTFQTKQFAQFRAQLRRARLLGSDGLPIRVKGFIGVARWATEKSPRVASKLLVEDPSTEGEPPGADGYPEYAGLSMVLGHYAPILDALQLPVHADAIRGRHQLPELPGARRGLWRCVSGPLSGHEFVGGLLPDRFLRAWGPWSHLDDEFRPDAWHWIRRDSPFILTPPMRFFGLTRWILRKVLRATRQGVAAAREIEPVGVPDQTGSLSLLRDGTVFGPAHYFEPIGVEDL